MSNNKSTTHKMRFIVLKWLIYHLMQSRIRNVFDCNPPTPALNSLSD